ncbi:MAG: hypothetical protein PHW60_09540 [Kiritimatiellae bacterium]|nr:hypothetical protein [Kiritimatiellia bacterium]
MDTIDRIENEIILQGRRNNQAWFEPSMGVIPAQGKDRQAEVFIAAKLLTGNDIGPLMFLKTSDLGKTWTPPMLSQRWFKIPMDDDLFEEPWFGLRYHAATHTLLALGQTHFVQDAGAGGTNTQYKSERHVRSPFLKGAIVYSTWNPGEQDFTPWVRMALPAPLDLAVYYNGQMHEKEDGTMLIPGYYRGPLRDGEQNLYSRITVLRCEFIGGTLRYLEHGSVHTIEEERGLAEPSLVFFHGRYFMTLRHNLRAYATTSADGLHFNELTPWRFDDGEDLGNYNTQQHWVKRGGTLYLIYNRKSELNNGVFRSRAPLFMAEVDANALRVRRATERIVFPEKGARMGNFCVADVSRDETWIVSGEWQEGMFAHSKKGMRFWVDNKTINYIRYIGDLLLARVGWHGMPNGKYG